MKEGADKFLLFNWLIILGGFVVLVATIVFLSPCKNGDLNLKCGYQRKASLSCDSLVDVSKNSLESREGLVYENINSARCVKVSLFSVMVLYFGVVLFVSGLFTKWLFKWRLKKYKNKELYTLAKVSLRQGFLASLLAVIILVFQSLRILIWWTALLVLIGFVILELHLATKD